MMAATAVIALANYVEGISITGNCFDTYTQGSAVVYDGQTGHTLELMAEASTNNGGSWTAIPGATVDINLVTQTPNAAVNHTYNFWIYTANSTYLESPYNKWRIVFDASTSTGIAEGTSYSPGVTSSLCSPVPNTPESPLAVALPLAGLAIFAGAFGFTIVRRRRSASVA
jgi:hypothetical protein